MSGVYGADVEQLRRLGRELTQQAEQLDSILGRLSAGIDAVHWSGPDAARFRESWRADLSPKLRSASRHLADAGGASISNAAGQEAVSGGSGSSGSGSGSTGSGGSGSGASGDSASGFGNTGDLGEAVPFATYVGMWGRDFFNGRDIFDCGGYGVPFEPCIDGQQHDVWHFDQPPVFCPAPGGGIFLAPLPEQQPDWFSGPEIIDSIAVEGNGTPRGFGGFDGNGQNFFLRDDGIQIRIPRPLDGIPSFDAPVYEGPMAFRLNGVAS